MYYKATLDETYGIELIMSVEKRKYREVEVVTTSYTIGDLYTPNQVMANGEKPYYGICAYNRVAIGTKLEIDGEIFVVKDRALDDDIVDIYMTSYEECIKYGKRVKQIRILEE